MRELIRATALGAIVAAVLSFGTGAFAQGVAPSPSNTDASIAIGELGDALTQQVRQMALAGTGGSEAPAAGMPRIEIEIGKLDRRLRLAPCQRIEPHLPAGTRLWGKTRIGLRCAQGPTPWNVYLPLTVKVFGRGLVATTAITANTPLTAADFIESEIDMAAQPGALVTDADLIVGRTLIGPLSAGQALRQPLLKARLYFSAGDTVRVHTSGNGFSASSEGQAMTNGMEGKPARVRLDNGKILTGDAVADHRMDVRL